MLRRFSIAFSLLFLFVACERIKSVTKQAGERVKSKSRQLIGTVVKEVLTDETPSPFLITTIVPDFKNDKTVTYVKGVQFDDVLFYRNYCVYKGQKDRVLKGVNAIVPQKTSGYNSDTTCYPVSAATFYRDVMASEKSKETAFFWYFETLKTYEVYTCVKAPWQHYLIFDRNSTTVYHRIGEIRD